MTSEIEKRKVDHLELCATDEVAFRERTTAWSRISLRAVLEAREA